MARSDARLRLVVSGVVASVALHALMLAALAAIPEPEKEPECPTEVEVCRARCDGKPEPAIPERCVAPKSCKCELAVVEPIPEIVALPTPPPPVVPEIAPPPPPPVESPPPPPPPVAPEAKPVAKEPGKPHKKRAREEALARARSVEVARVLGTYGGEGEGTVFDVIEDTDNQLGELFAQGMTTTVVAGGGEVAGLAAGDAAVADTEAPEPTLADVVRRKRSSINRCYTADVAKAGMNGKLTVSLSANDAGDVTDVEILGDTLGSAEVSACVIDAVERWKLPKNQPGDAQFTVVFTVVE